MSPSDALLLYLQHKHAANLRPGSLTNLQRHLSTFIRLSKLHNLEDFTAQIATAHNARLLKTQKPASVVNVRSAVIGWHDWLVNEGILIDRPIFDRVPVIKFDKSRPKHLTDEQSRKLLFTARVISHNTILAQKRDYAMLLVLIDTAVRVGELCNMKLEDLDLTAHSIRIDETCKGRKERVVAFGQITAQALRHYLRVRGKHPSKYLWVTRDTAKPSRGLILAIVKRLGRECGIPWITVHSLRHTSITSMVRSKMPLELVRQQAGHANIQTTIGYTHLGSEDLRRQFAEYSPVGILVRD